MAPAFTKTLRIEARTNPWRDFAELAAFECQDFNTHRRAVFSLIRNRSRTSKWFFHHAGDAADPGFARSSCRRRRLTSGQAHRAAAMHFAARTVL
jgi:hypothetical protein